MKYIPQAAPFEMIDVLSFASTNETQTSFKIRAGHLFVENNQFTEPGLLENMAQTAAAGMGYAAIQNNVPAPVGFIGAIKNFEVFYLPQIGERIFSSVKVLHQIMNAHIVQGIVRCNGAIIASAEFKIFLQ